MQTAKSPLSAGPRAPRQSNSLNRPEARPEVLVVDDHPMNRFVVCEMLEAKGVNATSAQDGHSALRLARERHFDLILMDLQMPGLDGHATTRLLQEAPELNAPPIVGLTASADPEQFAKHRSAGLDDCISKPLRNKDLERVLAGEFRGQGEKNPAPPPASTPHIDWQESLRIAGNRAELARDLLLIMLETLPPAIEDIQRAAGDAGWPPLAAAVHRLLGACRYTGAPRLTVLCERLEDACHHHNRRKVLELLQDLEPTAESFAITAGDLLSSAPPTSC